MPCCDTGRNIQKYKGSAASTLQDVTDNSNTTTGDIITTSGFFIGDGSKLTGVALSTDLASNSSRISTVSTNLVSNVSRIDDLETEVRPANRGGTGINSYTVGDILYASATDTLSTLPIGTSGEFLKTNGTTILWSAISEVTPATAGTLTANTFQYLTSNNGTFNGSADVTFGVDATTTNTTNKIVARDSNGDIFVSGVYGSIKGSNTINASTISTVSGMFGPIVGSNTINASTISTVSGMFGPIVGSNTINASTISTISGVYGPIKGSNTISASTIYSTDFYGKIVGSNTINASTISTLSGVYGPIKGSNTITASSIVSDNAVGLNQLNASNITSGTLSNIYGGTGFTTYSQGDLLVGTSDNHLKKLQKGTIGHVLTVNETGSDIQWQAPSGGSSVWTLSGTKAYYTSGNVGIGTSNPVYKLDVVGDVKIKGGMNLTSWLYVNGSAGTSGQVLTSSGGGVMSWTTVSGGGSSPWTT